MTIFHHKYGKGTVKENNNGTLRLEFEIGKTFPSLNAEMLDYFLSGKKLTQSEKVEDIVSFLESENIHYNTTTSDTDFGKSIYFFIGKNYSEGFGLKIRISDHTTGVKRTKEEINYLGLDSEKQMILKFK